MSAPPVVGAVPTADDGGRLLLDWLRERRRSEGPWSDERGILHVVGYDDTVAILTDPATFSSDRTRLAPAGAGGAGARSLTMTDPPEHGRIRRLIAQAFTPRTVAELRPWIAGVADRFLDALPADGEFDLVGSLADPFPVAVVAGLLDVPMSDRDRFRGWADTLLTMQIDDVPNAELFALVAAAMADMHAYMGELCRRRRAEPGDDLISRLAAADVDGDRLDDEQVADVCGLLLLAGHITTTLLIGNLVLCLSEQPGLGAHLTADPAAVPAAIEETLRLRSPFLQLGRVTTTDVTLPSGAFVPAGRFVMAWLLSANHDERRFADPERFTLGRTERHLAFGHGVHHCIGAALARTEAAVLLPRLLDRFGVPEPVDGGVRYHRSAVYGPRVLRVRPGR